MSGIQERHSPERRCENRQSGEWRESMQKCVAITLRQQVGAGLQMDENPLAYRHPTLLHALLQFVCDSSTPVLDFSAMTL
jgi:hypothetical protein